MFKRWLALFLLLLFLCSFAFAWWDDSYQYRRPLTVTNNYVGTLDDVNNIVAVELPADLNLADLIDDSKLCSDLNDLRVTYDSGSESEITSSTFVDYNSADQNGYLFIELQTEILNGGTDNNYYIYYGNTSCPSDKAQSGDLVLPANDENVMLVDHLDNKPRGGTESGTVTYSADRVFGYTAFDNNATSGAIYYQGAFQYTDITFDYWVKFSDSGAERFIMTVGDVAGAGHNSFFMRRQSDNTIQMALYDGDGSVFNLVSGTLATAEEWFHIEGTMGASGAKLIIDENLEDWDANTMSLDDISPSPTTTVIGCVYNGGIDCTGSFRLTGLIDEFRVASMQKLSNIVQKEVDLYSEQPSISLAAEQSATGVTADFTNTAPDNLDSENGTTSTVVDFNDTSVLFNTTATGWVWKIDDTNVTTDQNHSYTFNAPADYNVCLTIYVEDENSVEYSDQDCGTVTVQEYPQDVNFTYSPTSIIADTNILFYGTATDNNGSISSWAWDFNGIGSSTDQNTDYVFPTPEDWNICLTATDNGGLSKQNCEIVPVYGYFRVQFKDENTGEALSPSILFNGVEYEADVDGLLKIDLNGLSATTAEYSLEAWDSNKQKRYWNYDLNNLAQVDINAVLLPTSLGNDINFQLYSPEEVLLLNAWVTVKRIDQNIVSRIKTDSEGKVDFFLNPQDGNYFFQILSEDGNQYTYYATTVTVLVPKDEQTKDAVSPFDVRVGGLATQDYNGLTASVNFPIFSDTIDYYAITVDANSEDYYDRTYSLRVQGGDTNYTLQPYLVAIADSILSWFYTLDRYTGETISDVLIVSKKNIPDEGLVTVQSVETDGAGTAILNFIVSDLYQLDFYLNNVLLRSESLNPNSTTYYVYLDLYGIEDENLTGAMIDVNFSPSSGTLVPDANSVTVGETITSTDLGITSIQIVVSQGTTIISDDTYTVGVASGGTYEQDINTSSLVRYFPLKVSVTIEHTTEGTITKSRTWAIDTTGSEYNLKTSLDTFKEDVLGDFGGILIAVLVTLIAVGGLAVYVRPDTSILVIIAGLILGIFTYLGWIPITIFAFACLAGFGGLILAKRF